ncbi:MAG: IPT/TIG domain-containing protein [Acidobacteriota bacterium]
MKRNFILVLLILCAGSQLTAETSRQPRAIPKQHSFCGTYAGRLDHELRKAASLRPVARALHARQQLTESSGISQDVDGIAVLEDNGNTVIPANLFDLTNRTLRLTPAGSGSYNVTVQNGALDTNFGTRLNLADDDFFQVTFPANFRFSFFGTQYASVFVNSDGNLTFTQGDKAIDPRDLVRLNSGPPRLAPFLADLNPEVPSGEIYYNLLSDRLIVTWNRVREFAFSGVSPENTFQAILFADGSFQFTYGQIGSTSGIVGWSGGAGALEVSIVDFASTVGAVTGPVAERFSQFTEVDLTQLTKLFYLTHPDEFDQITFFTNFPFNLDGAFAFQLNIKNAVQGVGLPPSDNSRFYGSQGKLESLMVMNQLAEYPDNPDIQFLGTNTTLDIVAHEAGHRWLAFVRFRDGSVNSSDLLGRDESHWSFFFNSEGSFLEGNKIRDNGNGTFTTVGATERYSRLDQYLMGLRPASDVEPSFFVDDVTGTGSTAASAPRISVSFSGLKRIVTVQDIIAAHGPRIPDWTNSPKVFRQAFVLLVRRGTSPSSAEIEKLARIRSRWLQFFTQWTDGLASIDPTLNGLPVVPTVSSLLPTTGPSEGDTRVFISGANFQSGASVTFGAVPAAEVEVLSSNLIVARTAPASPGTVNVAVANPNAQPAVLPNSYSFQQLSPAVVPQNALRIPFASDTVFFRSNLGINNPSPTPATVTVQQLDRNGLLLNQSAPILVPANGFMQKNSILRELEGSATLSGREGSLVLVSNQPVQAFLSEIDNVSGDPSIMEGAQQGSTRLILQSATNTGPFRSNLVVLNLSATPAAVTLTALDRQTGSPTGSPLTGLTIPGNGFVRYDNLLAALGVNDSFGPVEIRSTNGASLAAVSQVSGVNANTAGFFVAQPSNSGSVNEIIPFVIDTDDFRTNLGLNNMSSQNASIHVTLMGADGTELGSTVEPVVLPPLGMFQINNVVRFLVSKSSSAPVTQLQGYLRITSTQSVRAFATQIDNMSQDPSIETSFGAGSPTLLLKSSANTNFRSTLVVVNPNPAPNTVQLTARSGEAEDSGDVTGTKTILIPAQGFFVTDNILQDIGATRSFGPIEIRSLSELAVIAVSRVYSTSGNTSGFFNAQPVGP